jgi:hypothetical protein
MGALSTVEEVFFLGDGGFGGGGVGVGVVDLCGFAVLADYGGEPEVEEGGGGCGEEDVARSMVRFRCA